MTKLERWIESMPEWMDIAVIKEVNSKELFETSNRKHKHYYIWSNDTLVFHCGNKTSAIEKLKEVS